MPAYSTPDIRNFALLGHGGAGKTSLIDALLAQAGAIPTPGSVEKGTTVTDYEEEEKHHQHSLSLCMASLDHDGKHINLLDTPGYPDFAGQALCALPAVETVAVVINAQAGIESNTRRMMDRAYDRKLCRAIIINKIDADNIDLPGLVQHIRDTFGSECLPINLPAEGATKVVDVFGHTEGAADFSSVAEAHTACVEQVVEVDEETAMAYLEGEEVSPEQMHNLFEVALRTGHLVPILFTSAKSGAGIPELLNKIVKLFPNPLEGNPRPFTKGVGDAAQEFHAEPDPEKHVIAHVFKVTTDPFVGKLGIFRIHQGTVTKDSQLYVGEASKPFKVGHLFKIHGKEHKEIERGVPGDIAAVAKVEELFHDAVLHDSHDEDHLHLKPLQFPTPMQGLAIEAKSRGDEQKLAKALTAMTAEDPCFVVERSTTTGETVIHGLGELHLRIILEKMKHRYNVEVDTKPPKIAYRETIRTNAEGHHRHKKQTGGAGQFGEVYLRVEPLTEDSEHHKQQGGEGIEFINDTFGGSIPAQFIPAIEKGVRQVLTDGCVAGYPMENVKVSVYDGKHHPVDSKEVAFIAAGKRAFQDAVRKAQPALLEPVVAMEVTVPNQFMGDITGDLAGKRGRVQGTDMLPGDMTVVMAQVPLAEVNNYQSQLKSVTGGQGSFTMEFSHYEPVPGNLQQQIVAQYKPKEEED